MISLARRILAVVLSAAMLATAWPQSAWAQTAIKGDDVDASVAFKLFRKLKVFKSEDDPLKSYLGDEKHLTPIGRALFLSLQKRYNMQEEVEGLQPMFEKLRTQGPYDAARQRNVTAAMTAFEAKFGAVSSAPNGSVEDAFRTGTMREALMNGAAVNDPPAANHYMQVQVGDQFEFYDREGLAFRMTKDSVRTYSRDLQKNQRQMNLNRPPEAPAIPETGRYNYEMFQYSYYRLKNQQDEYVKAARIDRMIGMAELLGKSYPNDLWFNDPTLEADLIKEAKAKTYNHMGKTYSVFDIVDSKFKQRRYYIDGAVKAVSRFEADMNRFKESHDITDAQVGTMALNEQNALRWLSLTVLETQMYHVKNERERVDPTSPDAQALQKAIDESSLTPDQKIHYKDQGTRMKGRLDELRRILDDVRGKLDKADYAGSLDMVQAALGSTQKELADISTDYAIYLELPSTSFLAKSQTYNGWNPIEQATRWVYSKFDGKYDKDMAYLNGNGGKSIETQYNDLSVLVASGRREDWAEARRRIIAMNPHAADYAMSGAPNGEPTKVNDALRISSSLKIPHDKIEAVAEKNKTLDAVSTFLTWTIAIALLAPMARGALNLVGRMSGPAIKLIQVGGEMGFIKGMPARLLGRSMLIVGEVAKHTAARLKTLEPGAGQVAKYGGETAVGQYLAASGMRAINVASRQISFTALSGTISAAFTVGTHEYDVITGNHSQFSPDWDGAGNAAWAGFKGGAWWANESFHPALGYIGLPSTVFTGTRVAGIMETIGTRGVVGSGLQGMKFVAQRAGVMETVAAENASAGLLERMSQSPWYTGKPVAAFGLSMADNVAKYALFSKAAGWLGEQYAWHVATNPIQVKLPVVGTVVGSNPEEDVERRIKRTNQVAKEWNESPAWLLIPTFAAHAAAEAAPSMRAREGALQYDAEGRTAEYLKKANGESVDFLKPMQPPLSQRLFEAHFFADPAPTKWAMTEQIRRAGIRKELVRMLAGPGGDIKSINPLEFYKMTKLKDNTRFVNVYMNDEVRLVAHQDFVDALLSRPEQTRKALEAKPGTVVDGLGRVTPEIQLDIAVALYTSEGMAGKKMPAALAESVNKLLAPYLEANRVVTPFAEAFIKAVNEAPAKSPKLDAALGQMKDAVREWAAGKGEFAGKPYDGLVTALRAKTDAALKAGELSKAEHGVMKGLYDYVLAIENRFNKFNNVETVTRLNGVTLDALRTEFAGRSEVVRLIDGFSRDMRDWASARPGKNVEGPKSDGAYGEMLAKFAQDLKASQAKLTPNEAQAMSKAITDMKASPWVLHDSKGDPLPSWRPAQFVSFVEALSEVAAGEGAEGQGAGGRGGGAIRLFQKLTTGGGKTMMTFEGLLPLAEADAAARHMEVTFLTVQSNLEAQARMEFIAFRKIGSKLTFDTYEGFKTKIAEGKMKGRNALKKYWILGDEMDGAALQPALTIGQVSGYVTRKSGVSMRLDDIDLALGRQLERGRLERASNILTEARRLTTLFDTLSDVRAETPEGAALRAEALKLEEAANKLQGGGGRGESLLAEAQIRESIGRVRELMGEVPSRDADLVTTARESLGRMEKAVSETPGSDKASREALLGELRNGFRQQDLLLGIVDSENGFTGLPQEARKTRVALDARIERLERELAAAEGSKAKGAPLRAEGIRQELELSRMEKTLVERFEAVDASTRLMKVDEQITALREDLGVKAGDAVPEGAKGEKLTRLLNEAVQLEAGLPPESRAAHQNHRAQLSRVYELGREMALADEALLAATSKGDAAGKLAAKERLQSLENERATTRASLKSMEIELGAGSATGDLGGMMRKLETVGAEASRLEGLVEGANARGDRAGPLKSKLRSLRSEEARLQKEVRAEVYRRFEASGEEIAQIVSEGKPGWENAASRLLERRRALMQSFTEAENPMYSVYQEMKQDAWPIANNEMLLDGANQARDTAEGLKSMVEQLAAFEKNPAGDAGEALPFLKEASRFHEEMKAKVVELETRLREAESSKDASKLTTQMRRTELERARIELTLVERFMALEKPGAEKLAPMDMGELTGKLDRMSIEAESLTAEAAKTLKARIDGLPLLKLLPKALWSGLTGREMRVEDVGLTRRYSLKMLKALFQEPMMDATVRDNLMWSFLGSMLFPKGLLHGERGSSWVRSEFINLVQGYHENPAGVRLDGRSNKFNVVHNGQWFESMDNATRRWWELEYGVDLTLPYTHQAIATIKDVTTFKGARFISLSGTAGEKFEAHMREAGVRIAGKGSVMPGFEIASETPKMDVVNGPSSRFTRIREALESVTLGSKDRVVIRPTDMKNAPLTAKNALTEFMAGNKMNARDPAVIDITRVESPEAQAWLRELRATQKDTGLVVLSVSDTRVLKVVLDYLKRSGIKADEIAKVFSDSEYLRLNVPEARVADQMNLEALNSGKVKVLILDTRVGGRGLDLNFKGDRANPAPDAFRGYTNMEMLVIDPESMSQVHLLQAMGRIDKGRVLSGVDREFSLVMDVGSVKTDVLFRRMFFEDPFFTEMRKDPAVQRFAQSRGLKTVDLALVHDYVMSRENDGSGEGPLLAERYRKAVKETLEKRQAEVEADQLRSSSVQQDRPTVGAKHPGLDLIR